MNDLKDLKDKFDKVYVLGSGPTTFKYENLKNINDPVFFINDTVKFEHLCPSPDKFFFSHHLGNENFRNVKPTTIFVKSHILDDEPDYWEKLDSKYTPQGKYIEVEAQVHNNIQPDFLEKYPWLLNKNEVIKKNRIATSFGTITTVIYMLWFVGCKECLFIGCDPYNNHYKHDIRIGGKMIFKPNDIMKNQKNMIKMFNLNAKYLHINKTII